MRQRGRASAAALSVVAPAAIRPPDIGPPDCLGEGEAKLFRDIVASCKPGHFFPSDALLLTAYVQAAWASRKNAERMVEGDVAAMKAFESATRVMSQLATRLRLTPQSRLPARVSARGRGRPPVAQLLRDDDEEE